MSRKRRRSQQGVVIPTLSQLRQALDSSRDWNQENLQKLRKLAIELDVRIPEQPSLSLVVTSLTNADIALTCQVFTVYERDSERDSEITSSLIKFTAKYYAPYAAVVNASITGKSRSFSQPAPISWCLCFYIEFPIRKFWKCSKAHSFHCRLAVKCR